MKSPIHELLINFATRTRLIYRFKGQKLIKQPLKEGFRDQTRSLCYEKSLSITNAGQKNFSANAASDYIIWRQIETFAENFTFLSFARYFARWSGNRKRNLKIKNLIMLISFRLFYLSWYLGALCGWLTDWLAPTNQSTNHQPSYLICANWQNHEPCSTRKTTTTTPASLICFVAQITSDQLIC